MLKEFPIHKSNCATHICMFLSIIKFYLQYICTYMLYICDPPLLHIFMTSNCPSLKNQTHKTVSGTLGSQLPHFQTFFELLFQYPILICTQFMWISICFYLGFPHSQQMENILFFLVFFLRQYLKTQDLIDPE